MTYNNAYDEDLSPYELRAIQAATQNSLEDTLKDELAESAVIGAAIQESLKSCSRGREDTPSAAMGALIAHFTDEEIAEDERRRERELYGPPSPPRRPRNVTRLNPSAQVFTPRAAKSSHAKDNATNHSTSPAHMANVVKDAMFGCVGAGRVGALIRHVTGPNGHGSFEPTSSVRGSKSATVKPAPRMAASSDHGVHNQIPSPSPADFESKDDRSADATPHNHVSDIVEKTVEKTVNNSQAVVMGSTPCLKRPCPADDASAVAASDAARGASKLVRTSPQACCEGTGVRQASPVDRLLVTEELQPLREQAWPDYGNFDFNAYKKRRN
ncbi:hypothetical protein Daus18300_004599 [Diaporthe australafricana]|uniref:Uncharacterized protein n=1 Tax=Diaporthe australafricana TaxID=127596 RepID=A0ABR3X8H1_9PEZI